MAQQFILQIENECVLIVANPRAVKNNIYIIVVYFNVINSSAQIENLINIPVLNMMRPRETFSSVLTRRYSMILKQLNK